MQGVSCVRVLGVRDLGRRDPGGSGASDCAGDNAAEITVKENSDWGQYASSLARPSQRIGSGTEVSLSCRRRAASTTGQERRAERCSSLVKRRDATTRKSPCGAPCRQIYPGHHASRASARRVARSRPSMASCGTHAYGMTASQPCGGLRFSPPSKRSHGSAMTPRIDSRSCDDDPQPFE